MIRLWVLLSLGAAGGFAAPTAEISPASVRQGEAIHLHGVAPAQKARLKDITIPLFPDTDGRMFGLMPVRAQETPGAYQVEFLDAGGSVVQSVPVTVRDAHYRVQNIVIPPAIGALQATDEEQKRLGDFLSSVSATRLWQEPLQPPVKACLSSLYGLARAHNGKLTGDYHKGVDQRAGMGTPIHPVAGGVVKIVGMFTAGGGTVAVDHGQGLQSIYLHMSKFAAHEGDKVQVSDVLGYSGSTGRSTGPHLHWGLYTNGKAINPAQWMKFPACAPRPAAKTATARKK